MGGRNWPKSDLKLGRLFCKHALGQGMGVSLSGTPLCRGQRRRPPGRAPSGCRAAGRSSGRRIGGAATAFKTAGVKMLEDRLDVAVLWDIRVSPEARGQGVGSILFRAVETWATASGCKHLKIETQNINVPACCLYRSQGCVIGTVQHAAYPEYPEEIQIIWRKNILPRG